MIATAFWGGRDFEGTDVEGTLLSLIEHGKHLIITDGVPFFPFSPSGCKYPVSWIGTSNCSLNTDAFWSVHKVYHDKLSAIVAKLPNVILLKTAGYLCGREKCSMTRGDDILYTDPSHLNVLGSRLVGKRMVNYYSVQLRD